MLGPTFNVHQLYFETFLNGQVTNFIFIVVNYENPIENAIYDKIQLEEILYWYYAVDALY